MNSITHTQRYLPHELNTKYYAVKLYRTGVSVSFVCRRYHISKSSLMRWNKKYDGTKESLTNKSHRPLSPHPRSHTDEELKWIRDYHRRNPNISVCELYGKLRAAKGYSRHPGSLYRVCRRLGCSGCTVSKKSHTNQSHTTRRPNWASSGRWTLNLSLQPAITAPFHKSFINTRLLTRLPENGSYIHIWSKAAIPLWIF